VLITSAVAVVTAINCQDTWDEIRCWDSLADNGEAEDVVANLGRDVPEGTEEKIANPLLGQMDRGLQQSKII
jgi:putative heme iron utilization protein